MPHVHVDRKLCQGLGLCEALAPHLFEITDEGILGQPTEGSFDESDRDVVMSAVEDCPNEALRILEGRA